jgi:hypothetical protein
VQKSSALTWEPPEISNSCFRLQSQAVLQENEPALLVALLLLPCTHRIVELLGLFLDKALNEAVPNPCEEDSLVSVVGGMVLVVSSA